MHSLYEVPAYKDELVALNKIYTAKTSNGEPLVVVNGKNHTITINNQIDVNSLLRLLNSFSDVFNDTRPCVGVLKYHTEINMYLHPEVKTKYNSMIDDIELISSKEGKTRLTINCRDYHKIVLPDFRYFMEKCNWVTRPQDVDAEERNEMLNQMTSTLKFCVNWKENGLDALKDGKNENFKK